MTKNTIYVVGHKNPDTDSICSAIAYAELKNSTSSENVYVPMRAGEISKETKYVLQKFDVPTPKYLSDVGAQVMDMEIRHTPGISPDATIKEAWEAMGKNGAVTQAITDEHGKIIGLFTKGDLARTFMEFQDNFFLSATSPRFSDVARTITGEVVVGDGNSRFTEGKVMIGASAAEVVQAAVEKGDMVILVDRKENQLTAIESGAKCLIICLTENVDEEVKAKAEDAGAVVISTPLDTYTVAREIDKSIPVSSLMLKDGIATFKLDDSIEKVKHTMASTRHRAFPVVDDKERYIGTVSRRNLLNIQHKQVILVDHNEVSQAVDNIDDAEILEIIDHHRLGTLQTLQPIFFVNQPVGCTATILYEMFRDKNIELTPTVAGLLCAAIISDTLMFRSPTCTLKDKMAAGALGIIADINIEQFATEMFEAGSDLGDKSAEEVFYQDYKKFTFSDTTFGVGQISSMSVDELGVIRERLLPLLENKCGSSGVSMVFFLLTDIRNSASEIIFAGEGAREIVEEAFKDAEQTRYGYYLEGVLSRKKQLIPAFMKAINA